jgi:diaminohydroxyphosphoribosylaminopyrimidine deaminase/5-amino-6-(5-phosphoribosylamino)uracil reductase
LNKTYINQAINEAWKYQFLTYPNPAVGACIVKDNKILSVQAHRQAGMPHAEVNAIKEAFLKLNHNETLNNLTSSNDIHEFLIKNHNNIFNSYEIYVTLEPCNHIGKTPSCANLLKELKFKKVYIGTLDTNNNASGGVDTLVNSGISVEVLNDKRCDDLLEPFTLWQKDKFIFFKLAVREDGTCDGGYITTQNSLNLVHEIRTKLDLMIIGGNTVRIDRPTLDSRFARNNKSCDIMIYSKKKEFDKSIPLFKVSNRKVTISDDIKTIKSNFTMIEGGLSLLQTIKSDIDMLMLFISHKKKANKKFDINDLDFKIIYSYYINEYDEILFCKLKK